MSYFFRTFSKTAASNPPLHEFINIGNKELEHLALDLKKSKASILSRIDFLKESNPMLGHRGCRLGISYPEITEMQVEALLGAALRLKKEGGAPIVEIMIPLVSHINEFVNQKNIVLSVSWSSINIHSKICSREAF